MSTKVKARTVLLGHLHAGGYDGLCTIDCGCGKDNLAPCESAQLLDCWFAYRWTCSESCPEYAPIANPYSEPCDCVANNWDDGGCYRTEPQP